MKYPNLEHPGQGKKIKAGFLFLTMGFFSFFLLQNELIKTKTDLNKRRSDSERKGNNWIEPLKDWILSAHQAEKLASSNDFDEIKSFAEKNWNEPPPAGQKTDF